MPAKKIHLSMTEKTKFSSMSYGNFMWFYINWRRIVCTEDQEFLDNELYNRIGTNRKEIIEKEIKKYSADYRLNV